MSVHKIVRGEGAPPVYRQIADVLQYEVQNFYQSGDLLPSETLLAERFRVNRHTLRRAVDELISEGLVVRRHGVGVVVLAPSIDYAINTQTRFTQNLETMGIQSSSRVIVRQIIPAQGGVAHRLALAERTPVIYLETLREIEDKPLCVIAHFLPYEPYQSVYQNYTGGSLHTYLADCFSIRLRRLESFISTVLPNDSDALQLKMPKFSPLLRVKSVNLNQLNQIPVEYSVARFRGDSVQLSVKP